MAKTKRNIGLEILQGLREIKRGEHGRVVNIPEIASIREKTGLSQARFAQLLGVSVRTLQDWEQGVEPLPVLQEHCFWSRAKIPAHCWTWREYADEL